MSDIEKARAGVAERTAEPSIGSGDDREDGTNSLKERDVAAEAASELARLTPQEYREMEKKLLWRIDKKLIPWMT